jgi:peroxiredoxin
VKGFYTKATFLFCILLVAPPGRAQTPDAGLVTFQKFVNGEVPVKEAVVYRELSDTNGKVLNKEWWRFGCQNGSWFVQRLIPDTNDSSKLVPRESSTVGASDTQFWVVDDQNLDVAEKNVAKGSLPDSFGMFYRSLLLSALSLGIPRQYDALSITDAPVKWNGLEFNTIVRSKWDKGGIVMAKAPMPGHLTLEKNGLPTSAVYPGVGQFSGGVANYQYVSPDLNEIPKIFTVRLHNEKFRFEFISLVLGTNNLTATGGYAPSLFADPKLKRTVSVYTNELAYVDGKSYPAFKPPAPKLGEPAPPLRGTVWFNSVKPLTLDALHGKVVLLDFWGIHCPPCIEAFPHIESLYNKFTDQGLVVIGVCGGWGSEKQSGEILKNHKVTFPVLVDENLAIADLKTGQTSWTYNAGTPSYALIDKSGKLVWMSANGDSPTESQIQDLLDKRPTR